MRGACAPAVACLLAAAVCARGAASRAPPAVVPCNASAVGVRPYTFVNRGQNWLKVQVCENAPPTDCGVKALCTLQLDPNSTSTLLIDTASTYLYVEYCEGPLGACAYSGGAPEFTSTFTAGEGWQPALETAAWDKYVCGDDHDCAQAGLPPSYFCFPAPALGGTPFCTRTRGAP